MAENESGSAPVVERPAARKERSASIAGSDVKLFIIVLVAVFLGSYLSAQFTGAPATGQVIQAGTGDAQAPPAAAPPAAAPPAPEGAVKIDLTGLPSEGKSDAKIKIVEFSDFQCPFCGRFYTQTIKPEVRPLIDSGQVEFFYGHFPLSFHPEAKPSALDFECVLEQDENKAFAFHNKMFENQDALNTANREKWAQEVGADLAKFKACRDSGKYNSKIDTQFNLGNQLGVSGTPTIFIGTPEKGYQKIVGAQPWSAFQPIIASYQN